LTCAARSSWHFIILLVYHGTHTEHCGNRVSKISWDYRF